MEMQLGSNQVVIESGTRSTGIVAVGAVLASIFFLGAFAGLIAAIMQ